MDYWKIKNIQEMVSEVLEESKDNLTPDDYEEARVELGHGEPEVVFNVLCNRIYEKHAHITSELYSKLTRIGQAMELNEIEWSFLAPLVKD